MATVYDVHSCRSLLNQNQNMKSFFWISFWTRKRGKNRKLNVEVMFKKGWRLNELNLDFLDHWRSITHLASAWKTSRAYFITLFIMFIILQIGTGLDHIDLSNMDCLGWDCLHIYSRNSIYSVLYKAEMIIAYITLSCVRLDNQVRIVLS